MSGQEKANVTSDRELPPTNNAPPPSDAAKPAPELTDNGAVAPGSGGVQAFQPDHPSLFHASVEVAGVALARRQLTYEFTRGAVSTIAGAWRRDRS